MGNVSAPNQKIDFGDGWPSNWNIDDAHVLKRRWSKAFDMPFTLPRKGEKGLDNLFIVPGKRVPGQYLDYLWQLLNTRMETADRIDAIGLVALYYVLCTADVGDKVKAVFALFDFDDDHAISKDELTILFISTCYALLAFRDRIPRDLILLNKLKRNCEKLAKDGFASRQMNNMPDKDGENDDLINAGEFVVFITKTLGLDRNGQLDTDELISYFLKGGEDSANESKEADKAAEESAAVKLQAQFRGAQSRKQVEAEKEQTNATATESTEADKAAEESAAVKLQAQFRGAQSRQKMEAEKEQTNVVAASDTATESKEADKAAEESTNDTTHKLSTTNSYLANR